MLKDRIVLVTGGTGAIGAALCRCCARHGADVAFTWHRAEARAAELSAELTALGRRCLAARVEATDGPAVEAFVGRVEAELGPVHALVNNLGAIQVLPFALIEAEDWDLMMQVNLKGMFLFSKAVVRGMIRRRAGVVLNLGSIAGHRMLEVPVHYATAKAAELGVTTSLAKELCRYGIRVNSIAPGLIEGGLGVNISDRQLEEYNRFCAMSRPGRPEEVAELAAFLLSDRAPYLNAQSVVLDGGL